MQSCLAFDTAGRVCSVAVFKGGRVFVEQSDPGLNGHAVCLVPMIQKVLHKANLTCDEISIIAVPRGPGSFTGIRVSIATAQGLILATKAKAFTPTSLEVYAYTALQAKPHCQKILVLLDNKRSGFYSQIFDEKMTPLSKGEILSVEQAWDLLQKDPKLSFVSDVMLPEMDQDRMILLDSSVAEATLAYWQTQPPQLQGETVLRPFYLHNPQFSKCRD